jgi:glutaredoxin-like YruB-family protein
VERGTKVEVKVYSTPTCPYCKMAKAHLDEKGIKYQDFDVTQDAAAKDEMIEKSGQMGVPVLTVDGELVIGFDRERLDNLLKTGE